MIVRLAQIGEGRHLGIKCQLAMLVLMVILVITGPGGSIGASSRVVALDLESIVNVSKGVTIIFLAPRGLDIRNCYRDNC